MEEHKKVGIYKKKDITVRFIPNLLSEEGRVLKSCSYNRDWTIQRYLEEVGFEFKDMLITVNDGEIKSLQDHLNIGDEIALSPCIADPITGTIATLWASFMGMSAFAQISVGLALATVGYSIYQAVAAQGVRAPSFSTSGDGLDANSPSKSWDGVRTTAIVGIPIPIIFGEIIEGSNIISRR